LRELVYIWCHAVWPEVELC